MSQSNPRELPGEHPRACGVTSASALPGLAEMMRHAGAAYAAADWTRAEELLRRALAIKPDDAYAHNNLGNVLRQRGRLEQALESYSRALELRADYAEAAYGRGVTLQCLQRFAAALDSYERAVRIRPAFAEALANSGAVLQSLGRFPEALESYARALEIRPDYAEVHFNRGVILQGLRRPEEALDSYTHALAIRPDHADAHHNRGLALQQLGRPEEALKSYERALLIHPRSADTHNNRGNVLRDLERLAQALESYERALEIDPRYADAYTNRGNVLKELERFEEALESYERALLIDPGHPEAHNGRGIVLHVLQRFEEALQSYEQVLAIKPDHAAAHSNRGNALRELDRFEEALQAYERALAIAPEYAEAYSNRGVLFYVWNRPKEAWKSLSEALAIRPNLAGARQNRAYAALLAGDFARGWLEHEWRWEPGASLARNRRHFEAPLWLGGELAGKTILLHAEQGLGDTLQFCRYAILVAERGAKVILEVPAALASLLSQLDGVSQVVMAGDPLPTFDCHCPLMSLPLAFGTTVATIPARVPYLRSDQAKVRFWRHRLGEEHRRLRVGLVWSGGLKLRPELSRVNRRRNIPLAALESLRHPEIEFYSLQKGQPAESELARLVADNWCGPELVNFGNLLKDFSDTAALVENLDLIISVDTAVAHLAGALGKPVWVLNRFDTCWRWLVDRTDSPWYPTLRLYRQEQVGDWRGVVRRIRADLFQLVSCSESGGIRIRASERSAPGSAG